MDKLFSHAFSYSPIGMALVDLDGRWMKVNHSLCKIVGYTEAELLQKTFQDIIHGDDLEQNLANVQLLLEGKIESYQMEKRFLHKDGRHVWVLLSGSLMLDEERRPTCFVLQIQDITSQKEAEKLLKENEQKYKCLFEQNTDLVYSFSLDGKIESVNSSCEQITGYHAEELFQLVPILLNDELRSATKKFQETPQAPYQCYDVSLVHKQGHLIHLSVEHVPILVDGKLVGIYGIAKDITEKKKAAELLQHSEKLSIAGQLAAGIAHEIRNPLTSLSGFLQLMETDGQQKQEYFQIMRSELNRIELIVNEMLLLAKPQMTSYQPRSLHEIVKQVLTLLESQAMMHNVQFATRFEFGPLQIHCDENQIKQVFINLIKNAIEAMPDGGTLRIETKRQAETAVIRFEDEGHGIPPDELQKLGQPFFSTKDHGTGLGLMISYGIIEQHQGSISVTSTIGKGTTFTLTLPASRERLDIHG